MPCTTVRVTTIAMCSRAAMQFVIGAVLLMCASASYGVQNSACDPQPCFDRCVSKYGGNIKSGDADACAKGCAGLEGGQVSDIDKFCRMDPSQRYSVCTNSCKHASSNKDKQKDCEYGCEYWK